MGPQGAPEEQRFDFGEVLDEPPDATGRARRRRRPRPGEDAASALRRRVDEVVALAHAREAAPGRGEQAMLIGDLDDERHAPGAPGVTPWDEPAAAGDGPGGDAETAADGRSSDGALSIGAFYERLRLAIAEAFPGELWVTGEIRGLRESRGHRYLELADHAAEGGGRGPTQQLEVVCWARDWPPVAAALAEAGVSLEVGRVVRVRGRLSVWEGGSKLRFTLTAIDIEALLGGIAAARHRLLKTLAAEGLLEANAELGCPLVPLRIGVVTSPGSEAHRDFVGQLERSGYAFDVVLERCLVQGPEAPVQIAAALGRLARRSPDLAVVVRGGGARGDLAAFDSEQVARAIATAPFPVWTGVGHTGDHSVADEVAHRALITPTACGQAVVGVVTAYVEGIGTLVGRLAPLARARLDGAAGRLATARAAAGRGVCHQLDRRRDLLVATAERLERAVAGGLASEGGRVGRVEAHLVPVVERRLSGEERELHRCRQVLRAYDPRRQLERGWSLTRDASGRLVRSCSQLQAGDELRTRLGDGEVDSVVAGVSPQRPRGAGGQDDEEAPATAERQGGTAR